MGDGSGDDVRAQLAALLGKPLARIGRIRKTDETPARISVIDVAALITGKTQHHAAEDFRRLTDRFPEVDVICVHQVLVNLFAFGHMLLRRGHE